MSIKEDFEAQFGYELSNEQVDWLETLMTDEYNAGYDAGAADADTYEAGYDDGYKDGVQDGKDGVEQD